MKNLYALLVVVLSGFVGHAQIVNIPDTNFKARLIALGVDSSGNGQIEQEEALAVTSLDVSESSIWDLTGIGTFLNLTYLNCKGNVLSSLNVSDLVTLHQLDCSANQLVNLNVSGLYQLLNLNCSNNNLSSINVTGTSLQYLNCNNNQLQTLNVDGLASMIQLKCESNQISSLDVSSLHNINSLYCSGNNLTALDTSALVNLSLVFCYNNQLSTLNLGPSIQVLLCYSNSLTSLDFSNSPHITDLRCSENQLSTLNLAGLTNLQKLYCYLNQLTTLDVSGSPNLQTLHCYQNQLTSLNISGLVNLQSLLCDNNQLTSLNLNGLSNLTYLRCSHNQIPTLNLSGLVNLQTFECQYNQLTNIDVSNLTNLANFNCSYNAIPTLALSNLTQLNNLSCEGLLINTLNVEGANNLSYLSALNNYSLTTVFMKNGSNESNGINLGGNPNLQYVCADESQIMTIQSLLTLYGYTNCHTNSYCSFTPGGTFYTIQGNNRCDGNNNGCDVNDYNYPNLKLSFSDGINAGNLIADTTGSYHYDVQAGTQTVTPVLENSSYFIVSPASTTIDFPTVTSPFVQNFCLSANGTHNDLEVTLLPTTAARPGFDATYKIIYKNKGTNAQNGTVNLVFNDAIVDVVSASPIPSTATTNNLSWSFSGLLPFETREIMITMNVNSPVETPAVNGGDVLPYTATVNGATDETPTDNTSTLNQIVVNSFDPNDKTCLEGNTIAPDMIGKYVHYMIRFENTGTFPAQNIVVVDVIDATKFDLSTLVPLSSSHEFFTRIKDNKAEFIFENINLPFDDANNDGYVAFKIKTKPTLVLGDTFSNTANIYFDYNFPIVTNTATTTIAALGSQDFEFSTLFSLSPVPTKNNLTITTKQKLVISSISIYNTLGQLVQVNTNPNETIDVSGLKSGSYCLKIVSDKGTTSSKFVKE
ncbi:DUF7619 domain-containing protein [Flavobacterium sp. XGLA_31]|uniref:DUF7619 domain-containing protein n=1 Tax=Flavobacterium sp. XGLA_31 TaxID=3447666 RepID=UPI003F31C9DC